MSAFVLIFLSVILSSFGDPSADLKQLDDDFFEWHILTAPEFASEIGIHKYDDRVSNYNLASLETHQSAVEGFIARAKAIDASGLSQSEIYDRRVLLTTLTSFSNNYIWRHYGSLNPITFLEGLQISPEKEPNLIRYKTKGDFENYISRLNKRPKQIDDMIQRFQMAVNQGRQLHKVSIDPVPGQIDKILVSEPEASVFYQPFNTSLSSLTIPELEKQDLRNRGKDSILRYLNAFRMLKNYLVNDYLHHTRGTYGVSGWYLGGQYYVNCLRWHLSTDMSPYAVHHRGIQEVTRISAEMKQILKKQNFNGTVAEYFAQLKKDPKFHMNSADQLLAEYKNIIYNRIYPQLPRLFKDIPDAKPEVKEMTYDGPGGEYFDPSIDGSRPGTFYVNLLRPNETNTFSMMALSLHETAPGHHLQAVYVQAAGLPMYRTHIEYEKYFAIPYQFPFYTAYTEGWALYAESLGEELGLYKDDYELMGRYSEEMFRACRLVVDTGLHYFGWSRNHAIEYMLAYTASSRNEIETEVDRYITWPGQACAYKIGELKIRELRNKAEQALGSKFDVRDFHSVLLNNGPVSLDLLEQFVDDWVVKLGGQGLHSSIGSLIPVGK